MLTFDYLSLFRLGFFVIIFLFTIHASIIGYHWLSYGASKHTALLSFSIYLLIGALLLLTMASSLSFMYI